MKILQRSAVLSILAVAVGCSESSPAAPPREPQPDLLRCPDVTQADEVPAAALGPAIPADPGYLLEDLGGGVHALSDGAYQSLIVATSAGVIVVDAPQSLGRHLLAAASRVSNLPITHVVYSHFHADHIGAADVLPASAVRIAHAETAAHLIADADPKRPPPTVTFDDSYTLTVGGTTLQLDYHGPQHVPGNIYIYAPAARVLMVVDIMFPGWVPFSRLAMSQEIPDWVRAHDDILSYDFKTLVGGHLTRRGDRADVMRQREYVHDVRSLAGAALGRVGFAEAAAIVDPRNVWAQIDAYLGAVARSCAEDLLAKWRGVLGGADIHAYDHCWTMAESLRID
jgi:glyoxylase-like metal-dependent hydrolase (beta-lactamase superfamily II)